MTMGKAKATHQLARLRDLARLREKAKLARLQKVSELLERQKRDLNEAADILSGVKSNGSAKIREMIATAASISGPSSIGLYRVRSVLADIDDISERLGAVIRKKNVDKAKTEQDLRDASRDYSQACKRVYKLNSAFDLNFIRSQYSPSDDS